MQRSVMTLATLGIGVVAVALAAGLLTTYQPIPSNGTLITIGVGVYWDEACTNPVSTIDWGFLRPNSSKSLTVYVQNNGSAAEVLSMTTGNWTPAEASSFVTLSWDREDYVLYHQTSVSTILTLSISPDISSEIEDFSFLITIAGTENQ